MSSFEFGSQTSETANLVKVGEMSFSVVYGFWRKFLRWSRLAPKILVHLFCPFRICRVRFSGVRFGGVRFGGAQFGGAQFGGAEFGGAGFGGSGFLAPEDVE